MVSLVAGGDLTASTSLVKDKRLLSLSLSLLLKLRKTFTPPYKECVQFHSCCVCSFGRLGSETGRGGLRCCCWKESKKTFLFSFFLSFFSVPTFAFQSCSSHIAFSSSRQQRERVEKSIKNTERKNWSTPEPNQLLLVLLIRILLPFSHYHQ